MTLCILSSLVTMSFHAADGGNAQILWGTAAWLAVSGASVSLIWRRSAPLVVLLINSVAVFVFGLDALAVTIALSVLAMRETGKRLWIGVGVGSLAIATSLWRDAIMMDGRSVLKLMAGSSPKPPADLTSIPAWIVLLIALFIVALALGSGLLRRYRGELNQAHTQRESQRRAEAELETRVIRQRERERIAREVHDTLAHRLSILSLHSGALEMAAGDGDTQVVEAARVVRDNAHRSLDDLRELIGILRDPDAGPGNSPSQRGIQVPHLTDLPDLVDSWRAAGMTLNVMVYLYDPTSAETAVGRAAYRVVQEALTNAAKHAPGAPVQLSLRGGPGTGVTISVENPVALRPDHPQGYGPAGQNNLGHSPVGSMPDAGIPGMVETSRRSPSSRIPAGSGSGLVGIGERVSLLGGRVAMGIRTDGYFAVDAWLPWTGAEGDIPDGAAARAVGADGF